tara:strand:+ start:1163 stop:1558 length:396 start_codon:yes stop_codon:yes gene_type:complete
LTSKTEIIFDSIVGKPKGLFDFLATTFASSHSTSFIYNTKAHFIITLYIKEQSGYAHFEAICKDIPNNIASRGTIQSILDMGVKLNIFTKLAYPNDKRVKLYNLSEKASVEVDKFFENFLKISKKLDLNSK